MPRLYTIVPFLLGLLCCVSTAQEESAEEKQPEPEGFGFVRESTIPCTPVKHQAGTGTCWAFSTLSFLESELIRLGEGEYDLSEMFVVRNTYPEKAKRYVRLHGKANFGSGGLNGDVLHVWRTAGVVPESAYDGRFEGESRHDHGEMDAVLRGMLDAIVAKRGKSVSPVWLEAVDGVLDAYLGAVPEEFTHEGVRYTPRSFADSLGIDPDDYVELTSYAHHPFYQRVCLLIPDNWARHLSWNVPLDELMAVMDHALELGYSVEWGGDTSEKSFKHDKGVAFLPAKPWADRTDEEQEAVGDAPEPELRVTQEVRQQQYDRYVSTDDHGMHLVGTARDRSGNPYYVVKNSWGTLNSEYGGFLHMSVAYARAKTISILVHRDAIPATIAAKLEPGPP